MQYDNHISIKLTKLDNTKLSTTFIKEFNLVTTKE